VKADKRFKAGEAYREAKRRQIIADVLVSSQWRSPHMWIASLELSTCDQTTEATTHDLDSDRHDFMGLMSRTPRKSSE